MLNMCSYMCIWVVKIEFRFKYLILGSNKQNKKKKGIKLGDMKVSVREGNVTRRLEPIFVTFSRTDVFTEGSTCFLLLEINTFFKLRNLAVCYKKQNSQKGWEIWLRDAVWRQMSKNAFVEPTTKQSKRLVFVPFYCCNVIHKEIEKSVFLNKTSSSRQN